MCEKQETEEGQSELEARAGLEILYEGGGTGKDLTDIAFRDLDIELREKYWIRLARDAGTGDGGSLAEITLPWKIERHELGRARSEPGDGFRYVFRFLFGSSGTGGRAEWFEVTEVFEGINPKDVKAFMRINNGGEAGSPFDPEEFLEGLDMGLPSRAAQRRAADKVIAAVEKKMNKPSYEAMWRPHGYGTLIVGLPLWFAGGPLDPLRVENVIDDFETRVLMGLRPYARQLKKKTCPFWRIVVVWNVSVQSMREWNSKARLDIHDDPAYRRMGPFPVKAGSLFPLLLELGISPPSRYLWAIVPGKKGKEKSLSLPPAVVEWKTRLDDQGRRNRMKPREHVKMRALGRCLELLCFVGTFGWAGLERHVVARLSPRRRLVRLVMRRRALRLYRASERKAKAAGR